MKCLCGVEFKQVDYRGKIPNYCHNCGRELDPLAEGFIQVTKSPESDSLFIYGRMQRETIDCRFDHDFKITKFPPHTLSSIPPKFAALRTILEMWYDGQIDLDNLLEA